MKNKIQNETRKHKNTNQEDGTWSDEPRCIEHEAGVSSQVREDHLTKLFDFMIQR